MWIKTVCSAPSDPCPPFEYHLLKCELHLFSSAIFSVFDCVEFPSLCSWIEVLQISQRFRVTLRFKPFTFFQLIIYENIKNVSILK